MHRLSPLMRLILAGALALAVGACGSKASSSNDDQGLDDLEDVLGEEDSGEGDADNGEGGSDAEEDTDRQPSARDLDCDFFCPLLDDCGYLDLAAGFLDPSSCPGFCQMLRGGNIPGLGDMTSAAICFSDVEYCDDIPTCEIPFLGSLPPIDQECVAQCRRWDDLTEDCAPPIVNELRWSVFGQESVLFAAPEVTAFIVEADSYAASVDMFTQAHPEASVWRTPSQNLITVIGVERAWLSWAFDHPDVVEVLAGFRDVEGRAAVHHGQFIVRLDEPALVMASKFLSDAGFELIAPAQADPQGFLVRYTGDADDALAAITRLDHHKDVLSAEPDLIRFYSPTSLGNDPKYSEQWHLESTGQQGARLSSSIRAAEAWELEIGSPDVLIAINDDGVDFEHEDLSEFMVEPLFLEGTLEAALSDSCCSHGTSVAGVAAARGGNGIGVRGSCPSCGIIPMFAEIVGFGANDSTVSASFRAAADAGAAVINNSWGMSTGSPIHMGDGMFGGGGQASMPGNVQSALRYAFEEGRDGKGVVIVFASGNDNSGSDYFGRHELTLTVGATTDQSEKAWYSSFGDGLVVTAPSNGGYTTGIVTTDITGNRGYDRGNYTNSFGGTSSASPLVAGLAGLVISANPELTAAEVQQVLIDSADKIDPLRGEYNEEGYSRVYGYGRVNAYRAIHTALALSDDGCQPLAAAACNGVDELCDGDSFSSSGCDLVADCGACILHEECESGICAQTPNDSSERCLPACETQDDCDEDWTCQAGACVPPMGRCDAPLEEELCNGRDDTLTGQADINPDGSNACNAGTGRCRHDSQCSDGYVCLGEECQQICSSDQDCTNQNAASCTPAKDAWGNEMDVSICAQGMAATCVNTNCVGPPFGAGNPGFASRFSLCLDDVEYAPGDEEDRCGGYYECANWFE